MAERPAQPSLPFFFAFTSPLLCFHFHSFFSSDSPLRSLQQTPHSPTHPPRFPLLYLLAQVRIQSRNRFNWIGTVFLPHFTPFSVLFLIGFLVFSQTPMLFPLSISCMLCVFTCLASFVEKWVTVEV